MAETEEKRIEIAARDRNQEISTIMRRRMMNITGKVKATYQKERRGTKKTIMTMVTITMSMMVMSNLITCRTNNSQRTPPTKSTSAKIETKTVKKEALASSNRTAGAENVKEAANKLREIPKREKREVVRAIKKLNPAINKGGETKENISKKMAQIIERRLATTKRRQVSMK